MCKFCDSNKEKNVLSYDNHDSMNIHCGQYQGVHVNASLTIKGNMLILNGSGNYRSRSDCFYENEGLDCDGEFSENASDKYIKIEYCPFCGKKLESTEFEKKNTKDKIETIKAAIKKENSRFKNLKLQACFTWIVEGNSIIERVYKMAFGDEDHSGNKRISIPLNTILKEGGNLKIRILYGENTCTPYNIPPFNPEEGIVFSGAYCDYKKEKGEFYGDYYALTDEQYDMLVERGLIKRNDKKFNELKVKYTKCKESIDKLEKKFEQLKNELKKL